MADESVAGVLIVETVEVAVAPARFRSAARPAGHQVIGDARHAREFRGFGDFLMRHPVGLVLAAGALGYLAGNLIGGRAMKPRHSAATRRLSVTRAQAQESAWASGGSLKRHGDKFTGMVGSSASAEPSNSRAPTYPEG
jgi:hypothetical protein